MGSSGGPQTFRWHRTVKPLGALEVRVCHFLNIRLNMHSDKTRHAGMKLNCSLEARERKEFRRSLLSFWDALILVFIGWLVLSTHKYHV